MSAISIIRFVLFGVIFVFSFICLGISANWVANATAWTFPDFTLAVTILTLVMTIPILIVDLIRKGAFVSWVTVELGWTGLLWVLWLASAAFTTSTGFFPDGGCEWDNTEAVCATFTAQFNALMAFQWLTWVFLFIYFVLIIILAIVESVRGNSRAWLGPVSNLRFSSTGTNNAESKIPPSGAYALQPSYSSIPTPGAYGGQAGSPMQPVTYPAGSPAPTGQYQTPVHTGGYGAPAGSTGYTGFHPVTPMATGQYQTPVHTGGYEAPGATGYAQPGQYGAPYGQHPHPNVAQV